MIKPIPPSGHPRRPEDADRHPLILVNEIGKGFHDRMRCTMDRMGIPSGYRALLFHLSHADGCTQLDLARAARLKAPTVSVTLQKMESDGYVIRQPHENDLRQIRVFLTEKGKQTELQTRKHAEELETLSLRDFSPEERAVLQALLGRMRDSIFRNADEAADKEEKDS